MFTLWCICVVLTTPFIVGLPLVWLLGGRKSLTPSAWIRAPFLGLSGLILILQNFVYLDVPVAQSAPFLWVLILGAWIWMYWTGHLRASFRRCPRAVLGAALAVYLIQGLGLITAGARGYMGRGWMDQFNYTILAESVVDVPFSSSDHELQPSLLPTITSKKQRVGQSVLHGFFVVSSGGGVRWLFEPTILLLPCLAVLAGYALSRKLGMTFRQGLLAGTVAGLLPALAMIHLEGFLSQAMCIPLFLFVPVLVHDLARRPRLSTFAAAALLLAGATAVYTEFWPLMVGGITLLLALSAWPRQNLKSMFACWVGLLIVPLLINPGMLPSMATIFSYLGCTELNHIYPWARRVEGFARVWFGDLATGNLHPSGDWLGDVGELPVGRLQRLVSVLGLAATTLGLIGLILTFLRRLPWRASWGDPVRRRAFALACTLLALSLLPVVVVVRNPQQIYQFYKVLLSISPLLVLGLGMVGVMLGRAVHRWSFSALLVPIGTASLAATVLMVVQAAQLQNSPRCFAHYAHAHDLLQLQKRLERLDGQNLLICYGNDLPWSHIANAWLAYAGRHNRVWLSNPRVNDTHLVDFQRISRSIDLEDLPNDLIVVISRDSLSPSTDNSLGRLLWSNQTYQIWKVSRGVRFAFLTGVKDGKGMNGRAVPPAFWVTREPTALSIRSSASGLADLRGDFGPGAPCRVRVENPALGYSRTITVGSGRQHLQVPISGGANTVVLTAPDAPAASGDASTPGLLVTGLRVELPLLPEGSTRGTQTAGNTK